MELKKQKIKINKQTVLCSYMEYPVLSRRVSKRVAIHNVSIKTRSLSKLTGINFSYLFLFSVPALENF